MSVNQDNEIQDCHDIDRFLNLVAGAVARDDRGVLADLRCGFVEQRASKCWPHIANFCDLRNDLERNVWEFVAAGSATVLGTKTTGNMGMTLRKIALGQGGKDGLSSFEPRFRRILGARSAQVVCQLLRGVIRAAKAKSVDINFRTLYWDLIHWNQESRKVRESWATAFWAAEREGESSGIHAVE